MKPNTPVTFLTVWIALRLTPLARAADSGAIEGRVLNASSGTYVKNARITLKNFTLETFTDENGEYRLGGIPSGEVSITAFYTGLVP